MQKKYMKLAIALAKKGEDKVYPNPAVGCVIVKDSKVIAEGWHEYFGGNHAEINALSAAGSSARDADLYVTLEPCNSFGKRPPCTHAIIKSGIKRVFFAVKDPDVSKSREVLEKNGIIVHSGLLEKEAKVLIKSYLNHLKVKAKISVKAAMTLDGKIATSIYDSKWITSEKSRNYVHTLRSAYDAVLVGTNTALKDNPCLTSHGKGKNPVRIAIDFKLKIPAKSNLFDGCASTVIIYDEKIKILPAYLKKRGIMAVPVNAACAKKDFNVIVNKLKDLGLKSILIEGGGEIISSALFSNSVDDIFLFFAPKIIGGRDSISAVGGKSVKNISNAIKIKNLKIKKIGPDFLFTGKVRQG